MLYFYPKDDTPGCTKEARASRDARADYEKDGAEVIGVRPDSVPSHQKFADKYELPFTLAADPERQVRERHHIWKGRNMYGKKAMGVGRTTFVIDRGGAVRKVFPKVTLDGHWDAVLETIRSLK